MQNLNVNVPLVRGNPIKIRTQKIQGMKRLRLDSRGNVNSRGFTLVEVMVATVLLSLMIVGILGAMISSYRVAARARYNDNARYIVKALSDQFDTQNSLDENGNPLPLFVPTSGPSGSGIVWTNPDGTQGTLTTDGTGYRVTVGGNTTAPITATVSRNITYLLAANGTTTATPQSGAGGYILRGDFTITYPLFRGTTTQTITNIRAIP